LSRFEKLVLNIPLLLVLYHPPVTLVGELTKMSPRRIS
jgi:hypothetical protein